MNVEFVLALILIAAVAVVVVCVALAGKWFRSRYSPWTYVQSMLRAETHFELVSPLSPGEVERRLRDQTSRFVLPMVMSTRLVGRVDNNEVTLRIHRPWLQDSFAPVFVGSMTRSDELTRISGVFRLHKVARIFMTIWFGGIVAWSAVGIPAGLILLFTGQLAGAAFVVAPIAMYAGGVAVVQTAFWFGSGGEVRMRSMIAEASGGTAVKHS